MEPVSGVRMTLEGFPGIYVKNKNLEGNPAKSKRGYATRSFTISLTPEYAQAFIDKGFPVKYPENNMTDDPKPYLAMVLFAEAKYDYPATVVIADNGVNRRRIRPEGWKEFDESPIEYIDAELVTYKNTKDNIVVKCEALYFRTKASLIRNKYPDAFDDEFEPAPFQ